MTSSAFMKTLFKNVFQFTSRHMSTKVSTAEKVAAMTPNQMIKNTVKVSDWNKRLLVFAGRYKSMAEIPDILPFETVDRARNSVRIRTCNIMIALTILGCISMVYSGKKAAKAGVTVTTLNEDWHKEYNDQVKREVEDAKKRSL